MVRRLFLPLLLIVGLTACTPQAPKAAPKKDEPSGVNIKAPGVEVNVDKNKGVDVKAPGVDVEVKPK